MWRGWWGEDPPYHAPVFVLTHYPHDPVEMEGGTTFHFVTSFDEAMERAIEAAGDDTVTIAGGASAVRQGFEAGVIDEILISHSPIAIGGGDSRSRPRRPPPAAGRGARLTARHPRDLPRLLNAARPILVKGRAHPAGRADRRSSVRAWRGLAKPPSGAPIERSASAASGPRGVHGRGHRHQPWHADRPERFVVLSAILLVVLAVHARRRWG